MRWVGVLLICLGVFVVGHTPPRTTEHQLVVTQLIFYMLIRFRRNGRRALRLARDENDRRSDGLSPARDRPRDRPRDEGPVDVDRHRP